MGAAESSAGDGFHPAAEDALAGGLASQIGSPGAQRRELERSIARELAGGETYSCLPAIPGVGPKTATTPAAMVDVSLFAGDDRLASYCGLAPADRQSGTSMSSASASSSGNKAPENLPVFSRDSPVGTRSRFGRYYDECRARGMAHNKALKAVARKRLGVIFAIMRDKVPCAEPGEECSKPVIQSEGMSRKCS